MPGHNDQEIKQHIETSSELLDKLDELHKKLAKELQDGFEDALGIPLPTAVEADIRKVDSVMKYSQTLTVDEFVSGALSIASAAFTGDEAELASKSVQIASDAIKQIFGSGSIQVGFQGSSAKIKHKGTIRVAACFAATSFCTREQWLTKTDFYVARYAFVVFEVLQPRLRNLLALEAL